MMQSNNEFFFMTSGLESSRKLSKKNYLISKNLNIVDSKKSIFKLIQKSSLIIYLYNSTGVYENLSLNIPTMFCWADSKNNKDQQNNDFIKFCKKNRIFHNTIDSLVKELKLRYNSIDNWWRDDKLQKQRIEICEKYSILPDNNSLLELSKKIKNAK